MNGPTKLDTTEIQKLRFLLDENSISYEVGAWGEIKSGLWESYNLHVFIGGKRYSFLLSRVSRGREKGLIEFYNFDEEPTGSLTADECMEIIEEKLRSEEL